MSTPVFDALVKERGYPLSLASRLRDLFVERDSASPQPFKPEAIYMSRDVYRDFLTDPTLVEQQKYLRWDAHWPQFWGIPIYPSRMSEPITFATGSLTA